MIRTGAQPVAEQVAAHRFDICLIDFGSSTLIEPEQATTFTRLSNTWRYGTDEYAAPEMLTRDVPISTKLRQSPSIDIYALCRRAVRAVCRCDTVCGRPAPGCLPVCAEVCRAVVAHAAEGRGGCAAAERHMRRHRSATGGPHRQAGTYGTPPQLVGRALERFRHGVGPSGASRDAAFAAIRAREVADQARGRISHWQALDGRGAGIPDTRSGDAMARAARPARRASTGASVQAGRPSS